MWAWLTVSMLMSLFILLSCLVFFPIAGENLVWASSSQPVVRQFPTLPDTPFRHDIQSRKHIIKAFANQAQTEPLTSWWDTDLDKPYNDYDFAPTRSSRMLKLLEKLKTLPRMYEDRDGDKQQNLYPQEMLTQEDVLNLVAKEGDHQQTSLRKRSKAHITEMIELVLYINQNEHRFQRTKIEKEITQVFFKEDRIETLRVLGEKREDLVMAKLLSHVSALSVACESQRNVLILEDTFKFYLSRDELQDHLRLIQQEFSDRWNVVVFGHTASEWAPVEHGQTDNIRLMRILQGSFTSGYLVNRAYIPVLLNLMIEHIYNPDSMSGFQEQLHKLQKTDTWVGFQSPIGGIRNETLDELSALTGTDEKPRWTIQKHAVYVKATEQQLPELNNLLRHLYLERYKGHRLCVAVHHPVGQKLAQRHKRSHSSTFYEGVKYFSDNTDVETYLREFETVQWIDLTTWCQTTDAINRLLRTLDDSGSNDGSSSAETRSDDEFISVSSSEFTIPCLNAHQRRQILT